MTNINVGDKLPSLTLPAISRCTLALFAGASGDHNPIHIDSDFAKAAGMDDVFAHGMLSMAYLGRMLTNWQSQAKLRKFSNRFLAITQLQDVIICTGEVVDIINVNDESRAKVEIFATKADGTQTLAGVAEVAI
ncbi:MaoC family dehydratase [Thalassotalea psychrophila]|uniref:MaoC family dehydratase n=1 Tax=Thalassotalea psychrophila TaxID=3065647 RepID=A0ABY9TZM0_9GAMM|nr:MaoC family dehydratase [Colwelliaceae bacterium SQ149]